jgi:hypothetical protein
MRTIHLFVTTLGLALTLCSWYGLARVHQYRVTVKQVQTKAVEKDQHRLRDLRRFNVSVTEFPSMEAILSELDAVSGLERGWWVVSGIGGAIFVAGLVGLVQSERLRRKCETAPVLPPPHASIAPG